MRIRIKYFDGATKLKKIERGNWIDLYANKDIFIPEGEKAMIPLGIALELPKGWEAHVVPRSSTFKTWGIIQTNHMGVIDDTYIGDNDQWHFPAFCLDGKDESVVKGFEDKDIHKISIQAKSTGKILDLEGLPVDKMWLKTKKGTWIRKGDKICQFRIMEVMPEIELEEVEYFGNSNRGGFGTTSSR